MIDIDGVDGGLPQLVADGVSQRGRVPLGGHVGYAEQAQRKDAGHVARLSPEMDRMEHGRAHVELGNGRGKPAALRFADRPRAHAEKRDTLDLGQRRQHLDLEERPHRTAACGGPWKLGRQVDYTQGEYDASTNPRRQHFLQQEIHELRVGHQVALPEPTRLLRQTKQPLQSERLQRLGGARSHTRQDVQGSADADGDTGPQLMPVGLQKVFLSGHAHAHDEDLGFALRHRTDAFCHLLGREVSVGCAAQPQARPAFLDATRGGSVHRRPSPEQIDAKLLVLGPREQGLEEIDAGHPPGQTHGAPPRREDDRLPIGNHQCRPIDERLQAAVRAHHHQDRDVDRRHVATPAGPNHRLDRVCGLVEANGIEAPVEDAHPRH